MNICVCLAGLSQIGGMLLIPGEKDISCRYCQAIPLSWVSTDHIDNIVAIFFTIYNIETGSFSRCTKYSKVSVANISSKFILMQF